MKHESPNTLWRDQSACAKSSRIPCAIRRVLTRLWMPQKPYINEHYARDIGLSPLEQEMRHLRYPSQIYRHPRL